MSATLDDIIDLREACDISGYCLRSLYKFVSNGQIAARQTKSGAWFTTRQEAERLRNTARKGPGRPKRR